jgi:hypothetical protein
VLAAGKTDVYLHERIPLASSCGSGTCASRISSTRRSRATASRSRSFPKSRRSGAKGAFQVVEFATTLTPLRAGALTVGPATMALNLLVAARGGDPFFGGIFGDSRRPLELRSEPLVLTSFAPGRRPARRLLRRASGASTGRRGARRSRSRSAIR